MKTKFIQTTKVFLILVVSFICTRLVGYVFFPGNSPTVSTTNIEYLAKVIREKPSQLLALFSRGTQKAIDTNDLSSFTPVSKGVYAKEENGTQVTVIKQNEMDTVQYSFNIDGKPLNIQVPVNSVSKEEMEKVLKEMKNYKPAN